MPSMFLRQRMKQYKMEKKKQKTKEFLCLGHSASSGSPVWADGCADEENSARGDYLSDGENLELIQRFPGSKRSWEQTYAACL